MRLKKLEKYINNLIEEKCKELMSKEVWILVHQNEDAVINMRPRLDATESAVNTMWSLPMFTEYRGKK